MNKKIIASVGAILGVLAPFMAQAFTVPTAPAGALTLVLVVTYITNLLWAVFIGFAVIMFLLAGFQFLGAQGEPSGVEKARNSMMWGVVGVVAGIIAFSLPYIITTFFGAG